MKENITNYYYNKMMDSDNPARELTNYYCAIVNKKPNTFDMMLFREMVEKFGKVYTYMGLIDLAGMYNTIQKRSDKNTSPDLTNYLKKIITNTVKRDLSKQTSSDDLSGFAEERRREIEQAKKRED